MITRLPPLSALKGFEAASRHLSFTRAAEELHVTQAAVSHQVKALEEFLGVALFRRLPRSLALTEAGQAYLPAVRKAFETLSDATARAMTASQRETLTVSVLPSFAARWLVPRLGRFLRDHPELNVRIDPSAKLTDFEHDGVDVGIRYGLGQYPGMHAHRLLDEDIFPVCTPTFCEPPLPLNEPSDLRHYELLRDDGHGDWRTWLLAAGAKGVDADRGPVFTDSSMLIEAAIAGQGVALAREVLARDALHSGQLVRPFSLSLPTEFAYYLVYPRVHSQRPGLKAFRQWILSEAQPENDAQPA